MPGYIKISANFHVITDTQRMPAYTGLDGKPVPAGPMTYFDMGFLTPDINGDGFKDLVISLNRGVQLADNPGTTSVFFLNDGLGGFTNISAQVVGGVTPLKELTGYVAGNLDGDAHSELLLVSQGTRSGTISGDVIAYYNPGAAGIANLSGQLPVLSATNGTGSGGSNNPRAVIGRDLAIGDLDRDGDNDIFVLSFGGPDNLQPAFMLINDGSGNFTARNDAGLTELSRLHFGPSAGAYDSWFSTSLIDANGDGAMDIVGGLVTLKGTRSNFIALNDGNGNFSETRLIQLPTPLYGTNNTSTRDSVVGDLNGDGLQDLVLSQTRNSPFLAGRGIQLLINENGSFSDQSARITYVNPRPDGTQTYTDPKQIGLLDFNNDGHMDIIERGQNLSVDGKGVINFSVFINDGLGNFQEIPRSEFADIVYLQDAIPAGIEPMWTDVNNDGITDFIVVDTVDNGTTLTMNFSVYKGTTAYLSGSTVINGTTGADILTGTASNETLNGRAGNDVMDGAGGIDTALFSGPRSSYSLARNADVTTVRALTGSDGTDTLRNIERLQFSDYSVALDLEGNAGKTAKVLGALLGSAGVANKEYVGIGLQLLDDGLSYENLMSAALTAVLGPNASHASAVTLLYTNLAGVAPGPAELATYTGLLSSGSMSQAALAVMAADTDFNANNIGLVGLAATGIEYLPQA
ncbi:MAG: VCBS repeat-containing protein [Gammaproteobacteria bacterium]|nr:VCBS repeat-containing protein [Gammaproteobacteria bacterium]MDP2346947.1 VCBS repeat-containing protein [Gammaproteobacteria bacterium]